MPALPPQLTSQPELRVELSTYLHAHRRTVQRPVTVNDEDEDV